MYDVIDCSTHAGISDPVDYNRYPTQSVQYMWIRHYLEESYRLEGDTSLYTHVHRGIK